MATDPVVRNHLGSEAMKTFLARAQIWGITHFALPVLATWLRPILSLCAVQALHVRIRVDVPTVKALPRLILDLLLNGVVGHRSN